MDMECPTLYHRASFPSVFLKVLFSFRNVFFIYPFGEVDSIGIIVSSLQMRTLKFCETKGKWPSKTINQVHSPKNTVVAQNLAWAGPLPQPHDCFPTHLLSSHFQELNKTTSFAWFPKLLIVPLFFVHLVDNKSIHLKTRRIRCSAVVCYTHVHFPYIFFEQNTVKSIVQLTGMISLW